MAKGNREVDQELKALLESRRANIKVVGVGGAGCNTASRMSEVGIIGAEIIAVNTDAQDLLYTDSDSKILVGKELTRGLGAGADPHVGMEAAKENRKELEESLRGSDMVFITCGLGGGTGTGGAPVIAHTAKKLGALTVGIVTLPFTMEGKHRSGNARFGLEALEKVVDTLIIIPNDKLLEIVPDVSILTAFKISDEVLVNSTKGIVELITKPGLVNLDFADVKAVMGAGGLSMIGLGESDTENRAIESIQKALTNPLLDVDVEGATGALINVFGGKNMSIKECQQVVDAVTTKLAPDAKTIWGASVDPELGETIRAMVIITGVKSPQIIGKGKTYQKVKENEIEKILGIEFV